MKNSILIILFIIGTFSTSTYGADFSQKRDTSEVAIYGILVIPTVYVKGRKVNRLYRDRGRLERIIAKVYPIAKDANRTLRQMERELLSIKGKRVQKEYVKNVEKTLKKKYTPILMRMSTREGIILLKLIDRETGNTSYDLVRDLRGGFQAFFWQGIARLFSVNLKSEYDANGDDQLIEYYIQKYEREHN